MAEALKELLESLNKLEYSERVAKVCKIAAEEPETIKKLLESENGDQFYLQRLGLLGSFSTKSKEVFLAVLNSTESSGVKTLAINMAMRLEEDESILRIIPELSVTDRKQMLQSMVRYKRNSLAQKAYPMLLAEFGPKEAAVILPLCDDPTVTKHLTDHSDSLKKKISLAKFHPIPVFAHFKKLLEETPGRNKQGVWSANREVATALMIEGGLAEEVLDLLMAHSEGSWGLAMLPIGLLMPKSDSIRQKIFEFLTGRECKMAMGQGFSLPPGLECSQRIRLFSLAQIAEIGKQWVPKNLYNLEKMVKCIEPSKRQKLFESIFEGMDLKAFNFSASFLSLLPLSVQQTLAKLKLETKEVKEDLEKTKTYLAYLSEDSAFETLKKLTTVSNAEERKTALRNLFERGARMKKLTETLKYIHQRIKNEQEPVQTHVLNAFPSIPESWFSEEDVDTVLVLSQDIIDKMDTATPGALYPLSETAGRLLVHSASNPEGPMFQKSIKLAILLGRKLMSLRLPHVEHLSRKAAETLFTGLEPFIENCIKTNNLSAVRDLIDLVEEKWDHIPKLNGILLKVMSESNSWVASQALQMWLRPKKTRDERVMKILNTDMSCIEGSEIVFRHIVLRRTDLLDKIIKAKTFKGKFFDGSTKLLPDLYSIRKSLLHKFTPAQLRAFAALCTKQLKTAHGIYEKQRFIDFAAMCPTTTMDLLQSFIPKPENENEKSVEVAAATQESEEDGEWEEEESESESEGEGEESDEESEDSTTQDTIPITEKIISNIPHLDSINIQKAIEFIRPFLCNDQARVAAFALRPIVKKMKSEEAFRFLNEILGLDKMGESQEGEGEKEEGGTSSVKLTVTKECIRMLLVVRSDRIPAAITAWWNRPKVHKDVRIALAYAARDIIDKPGMFDLLVEAATHAESDIVRSVVSQQPQAIPKHLRSKFADLIIAAAQHKDANARREAISALQFWAENNENKVARALSRCILDLNDAAWPSAVNTLRAIAGDGGALDILEETVMELAKRSRFSDESVTCTEEFAQVNAEAETDVPTLQRLTLLVNGLCIPSVKKTPRLVEIMKSMGSTMQGMDPVLAPVALTLLCYTSLMNGTVDECISAVRALVKENSGSIGGFVMLSKTFNICLGSESSSPRPFEEIWTVLLGLAKSANHDEQLLVALISLSVPQQASPNFATFQKAIRKLRKSQFPDVRAAAFTKLSHQE